MYRFDPGAAFEGELLSAAERMEVGGERLFDALFVGRDAATGSLEAIDLGARGSDGTLASLLDFRLDPARRRAITERTLSEHSGGVPRPLIEALADTLEEGAAILAVVHSGATAEVLEDAVVRCGGRRSPTSRSTPANSRTRAAAEGRRACVEKRLSSAFYGRRGLNGSCASAPASTTSAVDSGTSSQAPDRSPRGSDTITRSPSASPWSRGLWG